MESCGMSCIKFLLIVFNGLFVVLGILIIVAAGLDLSKLQDYSSDAAAPAHAPDVVLVVVGVLIILIAGFGCFGAWRESPKLLYIFASCLVLIILLELSVGIAAAALRPQLEDTMQKQLRESFIKNKSSNDNTYNHRKFWDKIQNGWECCGVTGPEDYFSDSRSSPSASCCPGNNDITDENERSRFRSDCLSNSKYYKEGCEQKVLSLIHGNGLAVIVTGILFCFFEVVGILLALWLAHSIKTRGKREGTA